MNSMSFENLKRFEEFKTMANDVQLKYMIKALIEEWDKRKLKNNHKGWENALII